MKDKILAFLANGVQPSEVATLVGCSPSYVSQLLKDPEFKTQLSAAIIENPTSADDKLEDKYLALEHKIVDSMVQALPGAELPHLTAALREVSKVRDDRHKRKNPTLLPPGTVNNIQVVQIGIPAHALQAPPVVQLNNKSEIVAIGEKPMAPLASSAVKNLFAAIKERKERLIGVQNDASPATS